MYLSATHKFATTTIDGLWSTAKLKLLISSTWVVLRINCHLHQFHHTERRTVVYKNVAAY